MKMLNIVILAAGKGERMLSAKPKVMHEIMGKPMIGYVIARAQELSPVNIVVVVGYGKEVVQGYLKDYRVSFSTQKEQKGTAHALLIAEEFIKDGDVLVLYGDVPLIESSTLSRFLEFYKQSGCITFMTTDVGNPQGYGRVTMKGDEIQDIIEDADATEKQKTIKRINTGICIIPGDRLKLLKTIKADNKKGEYYLTDICKTARKLGLSVKGYNHEKASEVLGINTRKELMEANMTMRDRILEKHMKKGVTLLDSNIYIEDDVQIGKDTIISSNCYIMDNSVIGEHVKIGPNVMIKKSRIKDNVTIEGFVVVDGARIAESSKIEPFSHLRPPKNTHKHRKVC